MKNEQIIMNTRVRLMQNKQLGTTGRKMPWVDRDGNEIEIDEPAEIHTYTGWKRRGFQVPQGTKSKLFIPIWNYSTDEEGNTVMMQRNAAFFTPDQVVPIEDDVQNPVNVTASVDVNELVFV